MADKLVIWRQALVHLGKATITTLTDDVEAVNVFGNAWDGVVEEAFNSGDWNFAKASSQLSQSATGPAATGWMYAFDYPSDYLRTIAVSPYPGFFDAFGDYVDEGGFLSANTTAIYLRYISDAKTADDKIGTWPTMFWRYVALFLAYETCEKLTNGATKQQDLEARLEKALRKAKSIDARNENNKTTGPGSWLRARYGYGSPSEGGTLVGGEIVLGEGDV